jgi:hypothetical protein
MYPRGNLTTGTFHPVSNNTWDQRDKDIYYHTGGPHGHMSRSADYKTFHQIDKDNNILHTSSANITHTSAENITHTAGQLITHTAQDIWHQAKDTITHQAENAINHIATNSLVNAVLNGQIQHIAQSITMGAPNTTDLLDDPPKPPQPDNPTNVSIIGSLLASIGISAPNISGDNMTSGGQPVMTQPVPPQLTAAPIVVTGDTAGNTALISLLAALVTLGLITNNTTDTPPP